jgi:hypothetical protein
LIGKFVNKAVDVVSVSSNRQAEDGSPMRRFAVAILQTSSFMPNAVSQPAEVWFLNHTSRQ